MLEMLRDLITHKGHASAALLAAIQQNEAAASDPEICELLRHTLLAERFWHCTIAGLPFIFQDESRVLDSFAVLPEAYRSTQEQQVTWLERAVESDLARVLEHPLIPGGMCSVGRALMQVCMHSHGHRAQCAKLFRQHGGVPPTTDFILWLTSRQTGVH
jgi:uncharacterized damage-inducible protein DinB